MTIDEISDNFSLVDEWDDRYRYIIELGRTLVPLPAEAHTDANKVQGCASQVWLTTSVRPDGSGGGSSESRVVIPSSEDEAEGPSDAAEETGDERARAI